MKPRLYIVAAGVSQYKRAAYSLNFPAKDATDFAAWARSQTGLLYESVEVRLLTDSRASRDELLSAMEWLRSKVTARDVAIMFLAGHGVNDVNGGFYFLPHDGDTNELKRSGVVFSELRDTLANVRGRAVLFVDACHSGNALGSRRPNMTRVVNELGAAENGILVFSASAGEQLAEEAASWGNGAFTRSLLEGLKGAADFRRTGRVSYKMLDAFVSEEVSKLTQGRQTPVTLAPYGVPDFALGQNRR